ncbi:PAAR domain-containing protein [Lysobacter soli]|uniref:PAAR domain-containing protein n=1 Tax=Lysobacter soli TaxID=453783 RepID=UPI0020A1638F|nr:PAAR domain-containing protein [Lysobacter soli]UTA52743.1 PAAR domain-containing protein [Lysobacter soli]
MVQRYVIVVGDPTTGGGQAIEGYPGYMIECLDGSSRPAVALGHKVLCGQCGPTQVTEGCRFFFTNLQLAYDGCALACGHKLIAKQQRLSSVEVADATPRQAAYYRDERSPQQHAKSEQGFDEHFHFFDDEHDDPLSGLTCVIFPEDAEAVPGSLNNDGLTPLCCDESVRRVIATISAPSPILK